MIHATKHDISEEFHEELGTITSQPVASYSGDGIHAALSVDSWPSPTKVAGSSNYHTIVCHFPRKTFDGTVRYADLSDQGDQKAAAVFFRHAGLSLIGRGTGGIHDVARFHFSPRRLAETVGEDATIPESGIWRGLDLSRIHFLPMLARLRDEMLSPGMASDFMFDAGMTMVMVELARFIEEKSCSSVRQPMLSRKHFARLEDRVRSVELPVPSVAELAQLVGMSERHLLRLFRAGTGEAISSFVRRIQIERARTMLEEADFPIKEIAFRLGFSNASSFTTAFRKSTGATPGEYRAQKSVMISLLHNPVSCR